MIFKIAVILICALLFRLGGWKFKMARRAILPVILAGSCAYFLHNWLVFLTVGTGLQVIGLGYGEDSPLYKIYGSWLARGVWGYLVALAVVLGIILLKEKVFLWGSPYIALNFTIGCILSKNNAPDYIIEPAIGAGISSIVLFI